MSAIVSGQQGFDGGGYVVPRPRVTDAIGGALQRSFAHPSRLPEEMRRLIERLDRASRRN